MQNTQEEKNNSINNIYRVAEGEDLKKVQEIAFQFMRNFADSNDPICKKTKVKLIIENCVPYSIRPDGGVNLYTKRSIFELFESTTSEYRFFPPIYQEFSNHKFYFTLYDEIQEKNMTALQKDILLNIRNPMERFYTNYLKSKAGEELFNKMQCQDLSSVTDVTFFQSNRLTQSRQKFTLIQKKFISYIIANFQKKGNAKIFGGACMDVPTAELVNVGCAGSNLSLRRSLNDLQKKFCVEFVDENGTWTSLALVTELKMAKWGKSVYVELSPTMVSLINRISALGNYTTMNLSTTMRTQSYPTLRLYELCSQYKNSDKLMVNITDTHLREILNCEGAYTDSCDFERYVIKPAQKELENMAKMGESELYFTYAIGKKVSVQGQKRRAIQNWVFFIKVVGNTFRQNLLKLNKNDKERLCEDFYAEVISSFFTEPSVQAEFSRKFRFLDYESQLNYVEDLNEMLPKMKEREAREFLTSSISEKIKTKLEMQSLFK